MNAKLKKAMQSLRRCRSTSQVANLLREHGIRGYSRDSCDCPIARFFKAADPRLDGDDVKVGNLRVWIRCERYTLPKFAAQFILLFDRHCSWWKDLRAEVHS